MSERPEAPATGAAEPTEAEPDAAVSTGAERPVAPPRAARIPASALSERNERARAKGLPGVLIEGGEDPFPQIGRAEERRYLRLLLIMVAAIVLAGFALGLAGLIVGGPAAS